MAHHGGGGHPQQHGGYGLLNTGSDGTRQSFCTGSGSVMMSGFQLGFGSNEPCILFLFPGWVMNNPWKYSAGCVGAFLIPVAIVALQSARDLVVEKAAAKGRTSDSDTLCEFLAAVLFGLQMFLAYTVMLLTMTYEAIIFCCIVSGFGAAFFAQRRAKRHESKTLDKSSIVDTQCCSSTEDAKAREKRTAAPVQHMFDGLNNGTCHSPPVQSGRTAARCPCFVV
ncbi:unnamed protein product [Symbiodinium sp. CCMP2592]|nr:unnamed protein product [Symbiodinium sp. CCMP2592]